MPYGVPLLPATSDGVAEAVRRLRAGGLVAIPTETVYGLAASASQPDALRRVFSVKGRPPDHPLIVHLADVAAIDEWADGVVPWARALADACWPGPLSIVVRRRADVSTVVTGGLDTLCLRVPDHPTTLAVLRGAGALAAPSANRFGSVSPTTAQHVLDDLGDRLDPATDAVLDGGACRVGVESTIVDTTGDGPVVLRPGAVTAEEIAVITGRPVRRGSGSKVPVPGALPAHYAPAAEVIVIDRGEPFAATASTGFVGAPRQLDPVVVPLETPEPYDAARLATMLYRVFREADALGLRRLVVERPEPGGIGDAVIDRLLRAAFGSRQTPRR